MAAPNLSSAFSIGIGILNTVVDATTRTILAITGDPKTSVHESDKVQWWQHIGFTSRPSNPKAGNTAGESFVYRKGSNDHCIASRDLRGQALSGNLQPGETCVYAGGADGNAQARMLLKADGSINLYTTKDNTSSGTGLVISITPSSDQISIVNSKGYGLIISGDGVKITAGDSYLSLGSDGNIHSIAKQQNQVDGGTVVLGSIALPIVNSVLTGPVGISGVPSTKIFAQT